VKITQIMFLFIIISLFFSLGLKCGVFFYHVGFFNFADLVPFDHRFFFWPRLDNPKAI